MDKALISFSFDDARGDNALAFDEILIPRDIPATLNVTTGYVDRSASKEFWPHKLPAMTTNDVIRLGKRESIEIAIHGDKHLNTEEDLSKCYEKLVEWFDYPKSQVLGIASPGTKINIENFKNSDSDFFKKKVSYVRVSSRIKQFKVVRTFFRKLGRIWHLPIFYRWAYQDSIMYECTDRIIYSVPILKDTTWKQVASLIRECIKKRGALVIMFHSINEDSDNWSWSSEKLIQLCNYIQNLQKKGSPVKLCTTAYLFDQIRTIK